MRTEPSAARRAGAAAFLAAILAASGGASPSRQPAIHAGSRADSADALQRELDAFRRDLSAASNAPDYFTEDRAPDLVVVASTDVHGEIEPCG